jgi:hypothetical protein
LSAFDDDDYSDWKKIVGNRKVVSLVNKEEFENFVGARLAARRGNYEQSIKICEELENKLNVKIENSNSSQTSNIKNKMSFAKEALLKEDGKEWKKISRDLRKEIALL